MIVSYNSRKQLATLYWRKGASGTYQSVSDGKNGDIFQLLDGFLNQGICLEIDLRQTRVSYLCVEDE
jgi:hypothetical protein